MSELWIAVLAAAALIAAVAGRVLVVRLRARSSPAEIADLGDSTSLDRNTGAVRSVQRAQLLLDERSLGEIWSPENLERLARTYWRFLSRVTLGVIRVHYSAGERSVVLLIPQLRLLTFQAPEYEMDASHGLVRWRIERGLLVSRKGRNGRGYLQIEVTREPAKEGRVCLHVEVEVANFYPSIASKVSRRFYNATQSRIHVIVTYGFLRSLARLDLAPSRVGRFARQDRSAA
jgi:hypothetical protein